jgi:hypothetical protein
MLAGTTDLGMILTKNRILDLRDDLWANAVACILGKVCLILGCVALAIRSLETRYTTVYLQQDEWQVD